VNSGGSKPNELPSLSLTSCTESEWDALMAQTARRIIARLDAWRAENQRIEAIFADLKRHRAITTVRSASVIKRAKLNQISKPWYGSRRALRWSIRRPQVHLRSCRRAQAPGRLMPMSA
jgi:hypothetical protein